MFGYDVLELTDSTAAGTCNLIDNIAFGLASGWAPQIPPLRSSTLAGTGPYEDVIEEIPLHVMGSTPALALANLTTLTRLLDQATRWRRGENVNPVRLRCQPNPCVFGTPQESLLVNRVDDRAVPFLPPVWDMTRGKWILQNISIRFRRRGQWLAATETAAAGTAQTNPDIMTSAAFPAAATHESPLSLTIGPLAIASSNFLGDGYLLIADDANKLLVSTLTAGAGMTTIDESANKQYGAGAVVVRYTATNTAERQIGYKLVSNATFIGARRYALFAAVRNNSATVDFHLRGEVTTDSALAEASVYTPSVTAVANYTLPQIIFLGEVATVADLDAVSLRATASSAVGSPTLDVNYIAAIALPDEMSRVISYTAIAFDGAGTSLNAIVSNDPLAERQPSMYATYGTKRRGVDYHGDAGLAAKGTTPAAALLGVAGSYWRLVSLAGTPLSLSLSASRRLAFLSPQ